MDTRIVARQCTLCEAHCGILVTVEGAEFTPELAAPHAGVDADTIRTLAREHAAAKAAVLYARIGVCQQVTGTLTHWLVNAVNAVTGNLDRAGGQMFATPPVDAARFVKYLPMGHGAWTDSSGRYRSFRSELPVAALAQEMLTEGAGRMRAMITYAGNPVLSTPQRGPLDAALESLDFFVAVDMYVTETSRHADIILPPVSQLEREDLNILFPVFSVRNNLRYDARVFDPSADGLEDWQILARLITQVLPLPARGFTGRVLDALFAQLSPMRLTAVGLAAGPHGVLRRGRKGLTVSKVRAMRGGADLGPLRPRLRQLIGTRDRTVHLAPPEFLDAVRALPREAADAGSGEYDLHLIGRRHLRSNNSWLHNVPAMVKGRDRCTALMHPGDAARRGLAAGEQVTVASRTGAIVVTLEVSADIRPGVVAVPHGWGHREPGVGWRVAASLPGANVNLLHDPALVDPLSGTAAVNSTRVSVAKADVVEPAAATRASTPTA